jgi:uncharacterized protein YkwD
MIKRLLIILICLSCGEEKTTHEPGTTQNEPSKQPEQPERLPPNEMPNIPGGNVAEIQQFMIFHNLKRCWHDAPRLKWNAQIAEAAKVEALKCNFTKSSASDSIAHGVGLGQIKAQDNWYMQFLGFPYGKAEYPATVGDFAHIVWQDSREFGCASVKCGDENVYYCKYSPSADGDATNQVKFLKSDFMKCTGTN